MEKDAEFSTGKPSHLALQWVERIENADPNNPDLDEDETDHQWGHQQFTQGSLTCSSVLTGWDAIGNVVLACRLLFAAIKTSKDAHKLCKAHGTNNLSRSYLSDTYVDIIVTKLWEFWRESHKVCPYPSTIYQHYLNHWTFRSTMLYSHNILQYIPHLTPIIPRTKPCLTHNLAHCLTSKHFSRCVFCLPSMTLTYILV